MELPRESRVVPEHVELILTNRQSLIDRFGLAQAFYTPPSREHYPHRWVWDEMFADIVLAREGFSREAVTGFFSLMEGLRPDGLLPNMVFAPKGRKFDPERYTFIHPKLSSDYTQPPLEAIAAYEIYKSIESQNPDQAKLFLEEAFTKLDKRYSYFNKQRRNGPTDPLIGNIHPHETGRDSDPTFDFFKRRLPRNGKDTHQLINLINSGADYTCVIALNVRQRLAGWDVERARQNFWVNDVMFNCIYADNLYQMAELARKLEKEAEADHYLKLAQEIEQAILSDIWNPEAREGMGAFYAKNKGEPITEISVSNLFPLTLPNLRAEQLESILELLESSFNTDYPIPSVPTNSPNYDPGYGEKGRLWRGPTWINMNWYLVERGLQMQASRPQLQANHPDLVARCNVFANKVVAATHRMLDQGYWEFYNAETGTPYRVEHFAWSTLGRLLVPLEATLAA